MDSASLERRHSRLLLGGALLLPGVIFLAIGLGSRYRHLEPRPAREVESAAAGDVEAGPPAATATIAVEAAAPLSGGLPEEGITLACRLLEATTGAPIASAHAEIVLRSGERVRPTGVVTDAEGAFEVRGLPSGRYTLQTRTESHLPDRRLLVLEADREPEEVVIRLTRGAELRGAVHGEAGSPVAGTALKLSLVGEGGPENASARADEGGEFVLRGLLGGRWRLSAWRQGFRRALMEVEVPRAERLEILLRRDPGLLTLVADESGKPLAGARVALTGRSEGPSLQGRSAFTDGAGTAMLFGLPDDPAAGVVVEATLDGYLPARVAVAGRDLEAGPIRIGLERAVEVTGRVVDGAGLPAAGVEVRLAGLVEMRGPPLPPLKTTAAGEFRFLRVKPGAYAITASTPDRGTGAMSPVEVKAEKGAAGLEVVLRAGEAALLGRVVDADGNGVPLCDVRLRFIPTGGSGPISSGDLRAVSGERGEFRFAGLPVWSSSGAACELTVEGRGRARASRRIEPGDTSVVIEVNHFGSIRGTVGGLEPSESFTISLAPVDSRNQASGERAYRFTSRDGSFRLGSVEPGTYALSLLVEGKPRARAEGVRVLPGEEAGPVELRAE